jgi:D-alanyl-D-alanine carboxypeptidase
MATNALKENVSLKSISAYRNYEYQNILYKISYKSAKAGYSEHQTGFSLDINMDNINFKKTLEYNWLSKNAYKYGFILRYPKNKENITGYTFEPWHFRYVGKKHAKYIYMQGLTLEEYIKELKN